MGSFSDAFAKAQVLSELLSGEAERELAAVCRAAELTGALRVELLSRAVVECGSAVARNRAEELLASPPAPIHRDAPLRRVAAPPKPRRAPPVSSAPRARAAREPQAPAGPPEWSAAAERLEKRSSRDVRSDVNRLRKAPLAERLETLGRVLDSGLSNYQEAAVAELSRIKDGRAQLYLERGLSHLPRSIRIAALRRLLDLRNPRAGTIALYADEPEELLSYMRAHPRVALRVADGDLCQRIRTDPRRFRELAHVLVQISPDSYPASLSVLTESAFEGDRELVMSLISAHPASLWLVLSHALKTASPEERVVCLAAGASAFDNDYAGMRRTVAASAPATFEACAAVMGVSAQPWRVLAAVHTAGWPEHRDEVISVARRTSAGVLVRFVDLVGTSEGVDCAAWAVNAEHYQALMAAFLGSRKGKVVLGALRQLHARGMSLTRQDLVRLLKNPERHVRLFAIEYVSRVEDRQLMPDLLALLSVDAEEDVQLAATHVLCGLQPDAEHRIDLRERLASVAGVRRTRYADIAIAWRDREALAFIVDHAAVFESRLAGLALVAEPVLATRAREALAALKLAHAHAGSEKSQPIDPAHGDWMDPRNVNFD